MEFKYKLEEDENTRKKISEELLSKYPNKVPIILEKDPSCKIEELKKKKYLLLKKSTVNEFLINLRKKIVLTEGREALFLQAKGKFSIAGEKVIGDIYKSFKDNDGFLYIMYTTELIYG